MAELNLWEIGILDGIQEIFRSPFLDMLMPRITFLGDSGWFWILLALLLLCYRPTRKIGATMGLALIFSLLVVNLTLKPLVARVRPYDTNTLIKLLVEAPLDFSFPSGHSQASFAAASALFYWNKKSGAAALVLAALIAFSRLYLYVHYPSDVLLGSLLGVLLGLLAYKIMKRLLKRRAGGKKTVS